MYVCIQGEKLGSVLPSEIRVTVGGGECAITAIQTLSGQVCTSRSGDYRDN